MNQKAVIRKQPDGQWRATRAVYGFGDPEHTRTEPMVTAATLRHLFTAAEAERALRIPAATIRSWAHRHRIWSYGLDQHGRPMYDLDDLNRERRNTTQPART